MGGGDASLRGHFVSASDEILSDLAVERRRLLDVKVRVGVRDPRGRGRGWLLRRALAAADTLALLVAFTVAEQVFGQWDHDALFFFLAPPVWVLTASVAGLYDRDGERVDHTTAEDLPRLFLTLTTGAWLFFVLLRLLKRAELNTTKVIMFWLFALAGMWVLRAAARAVCRRHPLYVQNAVVVGGGPAGRLVARKVAAHPEYGLWLLGVVEDEDDDDDLETSGDLDDQPAPLGTLDDLEEIVARFGVARVIFASGGHDRMRLLGLVRRLSVRGVQVNILPPFFDVLDTAIDVHDLEGIPVLGLRPPRFGRVALLIKRMLDTVVSLVALVLLAPLFALIALAIKLDSPGPVFFRQLRIGSGGRSFTIWKFRTMAADADERKAEVAHLNKHGDGDARMFKIDDDPRTTRVGRSLRRRSLDELPQLINVLRGEMSLVGPRPLIPEEDRWVDGWAALRLDLRPGMTGLWQVLGSDAIEFEDMVKLDYRYVTSWSVGRDLRLILRSTPFLFQSGRRSS